METQRNSGWRKLTANQHMLINEHFDTDRTKLYQAKKLADRALALDRASIAVLGALIGFFKEPLKGRLLVWPSNDTLCEATGYSERQIRNALRNLIGVGLLLAKNSPNGKRYAERDFRSQQITDAYGFDLSPLLDRKDEFQAIADRMREQDQIWSQEFDTVMICRRSVQEVIRAFNELHPDFDTRALEQQYDALAEHTPRRSKKRSPGPVLGEWVKFRKEAEELFYTANAGNNCRHKENNKDSSEQPCSKGAEGLGSEPVRLGDIMAACPDAIEYCGRVNDLGDLVRSAAELRGVFGTHRSAWEEACADLGMTRAAVTFMVVLQLYSADQKFKRQIKNFGGLFRATARKVANGETDLEQEILAMKRRRHH